MNANDLSQLLNKPDGQLHDFLGSLTRYVEEFECNSECMELIRQNITTRKTMTVYRGHNKSQQIRSNVPWFSTSKSKKVAKEEFSSGVCCTFTIHLENVPALDVYEHILKGRVGHEDEVLVLGGGTFYDSKELVSSGFRNLGDGEFECWYSFRRPVETKIEPVVETPKMTVARALEIIPVDEYEFIDSPNDITLDISDDMKRQVFEEIVKRK